MAQRGGSPIHKPTIHNPATHKPAIHKRALLWFGSPPFADTHCVADAAYEKITWLRRSEEIASAELSAFDAVVIATASITECRAFLTALRRVTSARPPTVCVVPVPDREVSVLEQCGANSVIQSHEIHAPDNLMEQVRCRLDALLPRQLPPTPENSFSEERAFIAQSPAMREVLRLATHAMGSRATVLIFGETGTGKEVLARAIHSGSPRARKRFVAINCAAFPETLLESELFGHVKGAFTGAERDKRGLFEVAHDGTLFLDEVGEMAPSIQAKLLRVLQERELRPVGSAQARSIDVRVIAASNRQLPQEVARGCFRADLYYRLAVFPLELPPLRKRPEDILSLVEHFLRVHGAREAKPDCRLSETAAELLLHHGWPGNVRELENEVQRALALAQPGETLDRRHFSSQLGSGLETVQAVTIPGETLRETLARVEAGLIRRALAAHAGQRTLTARTLGITREGLWKKMQRLGIE